MTMEHQNRLHASEDSTESLNDLAHHLAQLPARTYNAIFERVVRLRERVGDPSAKQCADDDNATSLWFHRGTHGASPTEVAAAWEELRAHPALLWIPPVWRTTGAPASSQKAHMISAIDRNLVVSVTPKERGMCVRLATGALRDKELNGRVDPTSPASTIDPSLDVVAESFDQAVLQLRNAVVQKYGSLASGSAPATPARQPRSASLAGLPPIDEGEGSARRSRRMKQR